MLATHGLLTAAPHGSTIRLVDLDDLFPSKPDDPLVALKLHIDSTPHRVLLIA